jgi:hypothetical protein
MSLAQIGEFYYCHFGMSMNVTSNFLYPVIVVSVPPSPPLSWWPPFQSFRTKITSEMVKNSPLQQNTQAIKSALLGKLYYAPLCYSNTYYNYNRNYPAVLQIRFAVSGKLKIWECAALIIIFFMGTLLRRVAVKEVEFYVRSVNTEVS